jgi:hypothetical protein
MDSRARSVIRGIAALAAVPLLVLAVAITPSIIASSDDLISFAKIAFWSTVSKFETNGGPEQPAKTNPTPPAQQDSPKTKPEAEFPARPFEYLGLRLGMSDDAVSSVQAAIGRPSLTVYQYAGHLYGVQQNMGGANVDSYVLAFSQKYGQPRVEQRSYRNGLGNEFHANVWAWEWQHESLRIHELCVGEVLDPQTPSSGVAYGVPWTIPVGPCLVLYSGTYAPKQALPEI